MTTTMRVLTDSEADADPGDCLCEFDSACSGLGVLLCRGCGGDLCICTCGGEWPCDGCEYCDDGEEAFDE